MLDYVRAGKLAADYKVLSGGVILSDRLPDKLVSLDQVRINRGLEKICQCQKRKGLREMRGCG